MRKNRTEHYLTGQMSRREFVEWAATGGLSLTATMRVLASRQTRPLRERAPRAPWPNDRAQTNVNPYAEFLKSEGIPVYHDYSVFNLRTLELGAWKRLGARGAYIDLVGGEGVNDAYVCEIPPGASTSPQRYLFEEIIYVLSGEGESVIWNPGGPKQSIRWKAGAAFSPPLNTWRQHFNRGTTPARLVAITNAPVVIDLFHDFDFVFNNDYVFRSRYRGEPDYFHAGPEKIHHKETTPETSELTRGVYTWDGGFVPDVRTLRLAEVRERGEGNSRIELQLSDNTMQAHLSEFAVGTYKKAHRHGPGSHVVILNGRGYTLMWKGAVKYSEAPTRVRVDWAEGSLFVPPDGWFHQHFNTGPDPARYLAATWGGDGKWFMRALGGGGRTHRLAKTSIRKGGNMIEYEDEDPVIREMFEAELRKAGVPLRMSPRPKSEK